MTIENELFTPYVFLKNSKINSQFNEKIELELELCK